MNRRQDSRMITEMKEQLRRLQERRQELESRQADEEEVFGQSIVPHLSRVMRDRQWAQVRCMIQRNMDSIDRDIQETIGRLGTAMLDPSDPGQCSPRHAHFPDLIPQTKSWAIKPKEEPLHSGLPPPGDPSRRDLLEAVKKTLEKRKNKVTDEEEKNVQSPRVGFYQLRHESVTNQKEDRLSRLSVQKLPSVTIATQKSDLPVNHAISVQSPSIVPVSVELLDENTAVNNQQPTLEPDDVARIFSDLLATQLDLAVDSIGHLTSPRQCQIKSSHVRDNDDNEFLLTIDNCTQTNIRNFKDSSTVMERWHQTDRAVGPDLPISPEPDTEEIIRVSSEEDIKEVEEPLTPPRASCINIVPVPTPALDLNLWRQRFPPTPPSSCLESLIRQVEAAAHETSVSTMAGSSSSDATGISSSFATTTSSSSDNVSRLSEGEVPNRVASPGQIIVQKTGAESRNIINRSAEETLSEGQIPMDVLPNFQFTSSLIDGSSYGEILLPQQQTSRSDSTASFQSATGSIGEIRKSSTTDELDSE